MRACAVRRDYANEAISLFERMRTAGYLPTKMTYDALLQAMGHGDDLDALDGTFAEAVARFPDDVMLKARLLRSYANHVVAFRRQHEATALVERAQQLVAQQRQHVDAVAAGDAHDAARAQRDLVQLLCAQHTLLCAANRIARADALADAPELKASGGPLERRRVSAQSSGAPPALTFRARPQLYAALGMYRRVRRAAPAVALAQRALAAGVLDGQALALALGACARAFWLKSALALWRDAARAGVHAPLQAAGVGELLRALKAAERDADATPLIEQAEAAAALAHRAVVERLPPRFLQLPIDGLGSE